MIRQCEYQRRYDPNTGRYELRHIYDDSLKEGSGVFSSLKNSALKLLGKKTITDVAKTATKKATEKAINSTSEYAGKKAGDKIIELLQKKPKNKNSIVDVPSTINEQVDTNDSYNHNLALQRLLAGSGIKRKRQFYLN